MKDRKEGTMRLVRHEIAEDSARELASLVHDPHWQGRYVRHNAILGVGGDPTRRPGLGGPAEGPVEPEGRSGIAIRPEELLYRLGHGAWIDAADGAAHACPRRRLNAAQTRGVRSRSQGRTTKYVQCVKAFPAPAAKRK